MRRDPWVLPIEAEARRRAMAAKHRLAEGAGGASDHLALVRINSAANAHHVLSIPLQGLYLSVGAALLSGRCTADVQ